MNQILDTIKTYFKGVKAEWGKISWPERKTVIFETCSVIVIVFVFTLAIYIMDLLFKGLLSLIKQKLSKIKKVAYDRKRKNNGRTIERRYRS